ncbi:hypothetical protein N0V93_002815 [Gnomoniopsis smithogilvyi]|uniref:Uncharacterized protein n=1 Tax=Gnomoniopsis smithogilvyi TaxID=1191159 RepID=A0A9W8YVZ4_9PEZI|nr:hypothetical protein N0V93_002815 [Gnomoniopsis smithogilvyi]
MGGSTRLKFPLPHRRSKKQPSQDVLSISAPMTNKAQKLLGSAEISIDNASPTSPAENPKVWETRSAVSGVSGISVTISETTTAASVPGTAESTVTPGTSGRSKTAWDQESDIIPRDLGLNTSSAARSQNLDITTDASSLRRRRSSSTIVSYYDKSKLPLSISQQTSNSAMAKGYPGKAAEMLDMKASEVLDMTCPRPAPKPPTMHRKKPSRLDLSHLLPSSASSRLSRFSQKGKENVNLVLGSDLFTRSPSVMSTPPAMSPSGFEPKPEKAKLRRKLTKESLRSLQQTTRWNSVSSETNSATTSLRKRATDTGNLNHLYEHYEKTSIRDTADHDEPDGIPSRRPSDAGSHAGSHAESLAASRKNIRQSAPLPSSPSATKSRHQVSPSFSSVSWRPFPAYSPDETCGPIAENPRVSATSSSLMSPAGDYSASVSSRHTRTSRASKTTESFADFDPNATSVLSLSSDSEDDDLDPPRTAASIPSVGSRDSGISSVDHRRRPSNTSSTSVDPARAQAKSRFRSSLGAQAPFLAIPEDDGAAASPLKVNPRSSSLGSAITNGSPRPSVSTIASSVRPQSRLSQASMSTADSVPTHFSRPRPPAKASSPKPAHEVRHVAMLQSRTATPVQLQQEPVPEKHQRPSNYSPASPKRSQPAPTTSLHNVESTLRDQSDPKIEQGGPILTLSGADAAPDERFISVTRQEEMLLAAMRAKRALMRENLQVGDMESKESKAASKNESVASIKTVKTAVVEPQLDGRSSHVTNSSKKFVAALHFPEPPTSKAGLVQAASRSDDIPEEQEDILMCLDRTVSTMDPYDAAEPSPDLSDFIIDFDAGQFPVPPKASHSRNSSIASAAGRLTHTKPAKHHRQSSFGRPRPDSEFLPSFQPASPDTAPPLPFHQGIDLDAVASKAGHGLGISNEPMIPITFHEEEIIQPPSRKKALRISAVGLPLPEVGQWGDDG